MPEIDRVGAYQTSTAVESSAGRPFTGRYCEKPAVSPPDSTAARRAPVDLHLRLEARMRTSSCFARHCRSGRRPRRPGGRGGARAWSENYSCGMEWGMRSRRRASKRHLESSACGAGLRIVSPLPGSAAPHSALFVSQCDNPDRELAARRAGQMPKNKPTAALNTTPGESPAAK